MDKKIKILYFVDFFLPHLGGVETVFDNIFKTLPANYSATLVTLNFSKSLKKHQKKDNLEIIRVGNGKSSSRIKYIFYAVRWLLKNKKKQFDLIHGSSFAGIIPSFFAKKIYKIPAIATVHEVFGKLWFKYKGKKGIFYFFFEKLLFKLKLDKYICVSGYTANMLRTYIGIPDSKIEIVFNGVENFWNIKKVNSQEIEKIRQKYDLENKFSLLYYGHTGMSKGFLYLFQAIEELVKLENFKLILNLIDSKDTNFFITTFYQQFKKYIPQKLIILNGLPKEKLRNLLASVDAVIAPSLSEGFGSVHTETCSMGKILITTYVGALPETVWGKIVFIKAGSAEEIIKGVEKAKNGEYTKICEKKFLWEESVKKLIVIYKNMISKKVSKLY